MNAIEKINSVILELEQLQPYLGGPINVAGYKKDYLYSVGNRSVESKAEMDFIIHTLCELGFLVSFRVVAGQYSLTIKGLERIIELQEKAINSNKCFIAMSFDENDRKIFDHALKPACETYGFDAVRVDGLHADSTQTINDLIISTLKTSRFCIADFTQFKNGVYFEAGYAAGRGMKVIYTCPEAEMKNLHFDVKHFQFILYKDLGDLKEKLTNKIGAYIID